MGVKIKTKWCKISDVQKLDRKKRRNFNFQDLAISYREILLQINSRRKCSTNPPV